MLLDLGVVALLPRETAFAIGRAGSVVAATDLPEAIGRTARIVFWQMPLVGLAALAIWLALPAEWSPLRQPLAVVMVTFVLFFPFRILEAVLNGLQELSWLGGVVATAWLASTATSVALIFAGGRLNALSVGWVVGQTVSASLWWLRLRRQFPTVLPSHLPSFAQGGLRDRVSRGLWVSMAQVAQVLLQGTDLLVIGKVMGPTAVVPYFCTAKVLAVLGNQAQMIAHAAQPALSELRASQDNHRLDHVSAALSGAILMMSGALACIVLLVNQSFVRWWVGPDQYGGFLLTTVLVIGMVLRHWNLTAVYTLFALGHDRRISLTTLIDGGVTLIASVALTFRYGLVGAALGTVIGVALVGLPANLFELARETRTSLINTVGHVLPWAWRFCLVASLASLGGRLWSPPATVPGLVAATLGIGAMYTALMWPLAFREPLGTYVRPRIKALQQKLVPRATGDGDAET
jgi:O-antigen/teichoic acid export membrane protein